MMKGFHLEKFKKIIQLKPNESLQWRLMKLSLAYTWLLVISSILMKLSSPHLTEGLCWVIPCNLLSGWYVRLILFMMGLVLCVFYTLGIGMKKTCVLLAFLSILIFSYEEANGIYSRAALFSVLFICHAIASIFFSNSEKTSIQFSIQAVAAIYTLSGLSKLVNSGLAWVTNGPYLLLQIKKGSYFKYYDRGNTEILNENNQMIEFFIDNPIVLTILLSMVLALEICSGLMIIKPKIAFFYGLLLFLMSFGIYLVMNILIVPIFYPMLIVLVNPLYLFWKGVKGVIGFGRKQFNK